MLGAIIGAVGALAGGIFGAVGASKQEQAQNQAITDQYGYDTAVWNFNNEQARSQYEFSKFGNQIAATNNENELKYREQSSENDWKYSTQMRDYEYNTQVRAYQKSFQTYGSQLNFNNQALSSALKQESINLTEKRLENAFQSRDLDVQLSKDIDTAMMTQLGINNQMSSQRSNYSDKLNELYFGREQTKANVGFDFNKVDVGLQSERAKSSNLLQSLLGQAGSVQNTRDLASQSNRLDVALAKSNANNQLLKSTASLEAARAKSTFASEDIGLEAMQAIGKSRATGKMGISARKGEQSITAAEGRAKTRISDEFNRQRNASDIDRRQIIDEMVGAIAKGQITEGVIQNEYSDRMQSIQKTFADNAVNLAVIEAYGSIDQGRLADNLMRADMQFNIGATAAGNNLDSNMNELKIKTQENVLTTNRNRLIYNQNKEKLGSSILSAELRSRVNEEQLTQQKRQADINAWANVMLMPELAPDLPKPLMMPRTILVDPLEPIKPPRPVKGATQSGAIWNSIGGTVSNVVGAVTPYIKR